MKREELHPTIPPMDMFVIPGLREAYEAAQMQPEPTALLKKQYHQYND